MKFDWLSENMSYVAVQFYWNQNEQNQYMIRQYRFIKFTNMLYTPYYLSQLLRVSTLNALHNRCLFLLS